MPRRNPSIPGPKIPSHAFGGKPSAHFAFDIFHTAQEAWDARFVSHSTRVRTVTVDAADVATTEFDLSEEKQELLVENGRAAARAFLDDFELDAYMNTFHAPLAEPVPAGG